MQRPPGVRFQRPGGLWRILFVWPVQVLGVSTGNDAGKWVSSRGQGSYPTKDAALKVC
jgi:hypothetical protein